MCLWAAVGSADSAVVTPRTGPRSTRPWFRQLQIVWSDTRSGAAISTTGLPTSIRSSTLRRHSTDHFRGTMASSSSMPEIQVPRHPTARSPGQTTPPATPGRLLQLRCAGI
jgi:hypothetical protein